MAHFAELDENNIVQRVIVVANEKTADEEGNENEEIGIYFCKTLFGAETMWKQTSYNWNFRKQYAGIGFTYDVANDVFIRPKPYDSWTLDEDFDWQSPVEKPDDRCVWIMASYRLLHVVRDGSGDTNGLAEYTNSDTVLLPVHSSDPSESNEGAMIYNSTDNKIKIYDGSAWVVVGNTSEQIQDIVAGQLVTNGSHSGITFTYDDSTDGGINATVSADSATIVDGDSDTKIQVDEGGSDEDKIRYDVAGTEVATQDVSGMAFTTNSGTVRHTQTQAGTYTIPSGEGQVMAGPVTITGTITNNGSLVII